MGICKSVVIATVVAIRGVVKNGFHCICVGNSLAISQTKMHHLICPQYPNVMKSIIFLHNVLSL